MAAELGKDYDEAAGLYYFNARWYDAELGRFTTEDPARDGLNWYIYVRNNPLAYTDPTGLSALATILSGLGTDVAIPEPTDAVPWKWVGWGVAILGALVVDAIIVDTVIDNVNMSKGADDEPEITTDNPPIKGKPNSTTTQVDEDGNPRKDRHYGPDGNADFDIDYTDHGNPKNHPDVPHKHDWDWSNPDSPARGPGTPIE